MKAIGKVIKRRNRIMHYNNGSRYKGDWINDKREGKGIIYYNGDRYKDDWINDKIEGKGIMYYSNADRYEGDFNYFYEKNKIMINKYKHKIK